MTGGRFAAGLVLIALAILVAPVPDTDFAAAVVHQRGGSPVVAVGNSIVDYVGRCDSDRRTIPQLLADRTGLKVADSSWGGQSVGTSVALAAIALKAKNVRVVVVPVAANALSFGDSLPLQTLSFARLTGGYLESADYAARLRNGIGLSPSVAPYQQPFSYKGVHYPDYNGIKIKYLSSEVAHTVCPENLGVNRRFLAGYYWANYNAGTVQAALLRDLARLQAKAKGEGKRVVVVLLPLDFEDAAALGPDVAAAMARRRREVLAAAGIAGLDMLDLSGGEPVSSFAQRWCACGHLSEQGRHHVVDRLAGTVR